MLRSLATTVALAVAAIVFAVATAEAAPLTNIYGNLGTVNASTTSNTVGYLSLAQPNQFQAQGFSVGNQVGSSAWDIQEIQVGLGASGSPSPVVAIYSDFASINGAVPGTPLATFTGTSAVSAKGIYTFTGSFTALQNTSYWVVLANGNSASLESYEWYTNDAFTQPTQQNASNVTYLGTSERNDVAGTWTSAIPSLSIQVNAVAAVPEPPPETSGGGFVVLGLTQSVSAGSAQVENLCYGGHAGCTGERGAACASDPAAHLPESRQSSMRTWKTHRLTTCATGWSEGLPVPQSRAMGASAATTNPPAAHRCPAKRSGHAMSGCHDGIRECPATGHGQSRASRTAQDQV